VRLLALALALALGASGCALLSPAQVDAVHGFAHATKDFTELPPSVLEAYGDVHAERELLSLVALRQGAELPNLERAVASRGKVDANVATLRAGLSVLQAYADILETLSSDHLANVDDAMVGMGTGLDETAGKYNAAKGTDALPLIGAAVAAGVRGAAGVFASMKQHQWLKAYVTQAEPMVHTLTKDIAAALGPFADETFASETEQVKKTFAMTGGKLPYDEAAAYYRALRELESAQRLAREAVAASTVCDTAHSALKEALQTPLSLGTAVEQVKAMAEHVKAATDVKKKVEDAEKD
jgi:hypothetical protein